MKNIFFTPIFLFSLSTSATDFISPTESDPIPFIISGNDLMSDYNDYKKQDSAQHFGTANYMGFVTGVYEVAKYTAFCPPDGMTVGQISSVVGKYLEANPERLHLSAARLTLEALVKNYPCKKAK